MHPRFPWLGSQIIPSDQNLFSRDLAMCHNAVSVIFDVFRLCCTVDLLAYYFTEYVNLGTDREQQLCILDGERLEVILGELDVPGSRGKIRFQGEKMPPIPVDLPTRFGTSDY